MSEVDFAKLVTYVKCSSLGEKVDDNPCPYYEELAGNGQCRHWDYGDDGCHSSRVKSILMEEEK